MLSQQNQVIPCENTRLDDFDALKFEEQRFEVFQQTEKPTPLSDIALDADWDARMSIEPVEHQWLDPEYRAAYLSAIAAKYDEKFGVSI